MTITEDPPVELVDDPEESSGPARPDNVSGDVPDDDRAPIQPKSLAIAWALITVVGIAVVLMAIGPVSEERDQRSLLAAYRVEVEAASNQAFGLGGIQTPTNAPASGDPVAVLDIEAIGLSRVVVEGTAPEQTRQGPGHVVGTGGPGQPGNSTFVGRRALFGGAFGDLALLETGDRILVTTTQGRSVYQVDHVGIHIVEDSASTESATPSTTTTIAVPGTDGAATGDGAEAEAEAADAADEAVLPDGPVTTDDLYGPSPDDRLTLVTTASGGLMPSEEALVVVARMDGQAFPPTPQGGRTPGNDGRSGSSGNWAALVLAFLAYVVAVVGAIWLNRNVPWRSAYLLTAPVLVALTIVLADQLVNFLPAWS